MEKKVKVCITTVVDELYQKYIPLFVLCCKYAYPEYDIKIFLHGNIRENVKKALEFLKDKYIFVNGLFDGWKKYKYSPISWRFVVPPEQYKGYDYVYITDIDMLIFREKVELASFHINEMNETGLCYSNSTRNKKHWEGNRSLTGLHFCNQEWFEKTEASRRRYAQLLKIGKVGEKREYDGYMLYSMCIESDLTIAGKYPLIERHHGIHLGTERLFHKNKKIKKRLNPDYLTKWNNLIKTKNYSEIYYLMSDDEIIKRQIYWLNTHCKAILK